MAPLRGVTGDTSAPKRFLVAGVSPGVGNIELDVEVGLERTGVNGGLLKATEDDMMKENESWGKHGLQWKENNLRDGNVWPTTTR